MKGEWQTCEICFGSRPTLTSSLNGAFSQPAWGRCGYGTRQPLMVISPFAKRNHIDHTLTDQASVLRFIEDNWLSGERIQPGASFDTIAGTIEHMFNFDRNVANDDRKLILDPQTGAIVFSSHRDDACTRHMFCFVPTYQTPLAGY